MLEAEVRQGIQEHAITARNPNISKPNVEPLMSVREVWGWISAMCYQYERYGDG